MSNLERLGCPLVMPGNKKKKKLFEKRKSLQVTSFLASLPLKRSYLFHQRGQKIFLWLAVPMPVLTRGKFYMRVVTAYYVEFSGTKECMSSFLKFYNANYVY